MSGSEDSGRLARRQFVVLSGAVGAAAILAGTGAVRSAAAPAPPEDEEPSPCPPSPGPPSGSNSCPPAALQSVCGKPGDDDPLWHDVQYCINGTPPPPPQRPPECLNKTSDYVVLHGKPENQHDFLLSAACRITGIECPFLETAEAPNYWSYAWDNAKPGGNVPVVYDNIGLGINSKPARRFDQLHIHMAGVRDSTQLRMRDLETMGRVAVDPRRWIDPQYQVPVTGSNGDRTYRALKLPSLRRNLFSLLDQYVATPSGVAMAYQTLIVVPKKTTAGYDGTFYVLNSDQSLHDGTNTCDHLLVYD